ncbi:MAG TPA: hypothetical protein VM802_13185 [Chitinophaga sp.]|uniref:hypothetical protein n=1 Tax=Chitinophaga sp. TaxID=1869181 RepID=UPI002C0D8241|nr:hypothetical protein [Chitinophaga sp.]HVI45822.1 hypothetical protein [Chitinophaga sp.]
MICRLTKIREFDAMGGPGKPVKGSDGFMRTQTRAGRYVIATIEKHVSSDRYGFWSGLPWGTPMRLSAKNITEVKARGKWIPLTSVNAKWGTGARTQDKVTETIRDYYKQLGYHGSFPDKWVFNDFGHNSIKYFVDTNHNWRKDGKEAVIGDFVHTTPGNEAQTFLGDTVKLDHSHGCIHLMPGDMDNLTGSGYAQPGTSLEVHPYTDLHIPTDTTRDPARPGFEIHFFPGVDKMVIYQSEAMASVNDSTTNKRPASRDTLHRNH